jgi:hypothetical protein
MCHIVLLCTIFLVSPSVAHHVVSYLDQEWCKHHFQVQQKSGINLCPDWIVQPIEPCGLKFFWAERVRDRNFFAAI